MFKSATPGNILMVRLGAMGDVIHALPSAVWLKRSFPETRLSWLIESRWSVLLEGNPFVDETLVFERSFHGARKCCRELRRRNFEFAVDFQGLFKSAIPAWLSGAPKVIGFADARERSTAVFYSKRVLPDAVHVVERNLQLARAAGAQPGSVEFPIPAGTPEGDLPDGPFVLASPLAGWVSKQWPLEYYGALARILAAHGLPLVLNGAPVAREMLAAVPGAVTHISSVAGLIDATRRAAAVVGVDSGPLHLAAALAKPGVAIFGPTDPARNGPYGGSFTVLRSPRAVTTYKRGSHTDDSMRDIAAAQVFTAFQERLRL